jgi:hypothetical protein
MSDPLDDTTGQEHIPPWTEKPKYPDDRSWAEHADASVSDPRGSRRDFGVVLGTWLAYGLMIAVVGLVVPVVLWLIGITLGFFYQAFMAGWDIGT